MYAAVVTRPDIAFATSRLSRFNINPDDQHHRAADRVIHYLVATKHLALQLGGGDAYEVASDASFADNSIDRKSSQGYAMKLFGGTIGWQASKQATVTTSTTEAELLALSHAVKEAMFTAYLLQELGIKLAKETKPIPIHCDNLQTLKLITKDVNALHTRLRHVDIHNHWLRQEYHDGRISPVHVPTKEMVADGLTKALIGDQFHAFVARLGLVNVEDLIEARRQRDLTRDIERWEKLLAADTD